MKAYKVYYIINGGSENIVTVYADTEHEALKNAKILNENRSKLESQTIIYTRVVEI